MRNYANKWPHWRNHGSHSAIFCVCGWSDRAHLETSWTNIMQNPKYLVSKFLLFTDICFSFVNLPHLISALVCWFCARPQLYHLLEKYWEERRSPGLPITWEKNICVSHVWPMLFALFCHISFYSIELGTYCLFLADFNLSVKKYYIQHTCCKKLHFRAVLNKIIKHMLQVLHDLKKKHRFALLQYICEEIKKNHNKWLKWLTWI